MSTIIESIEQRQLRKVPRFESGDRVRVHFQVIEGTRKRTQVFEGIVIARQGSGARDVLRAHYGSVVSEEEFQAERDVIDPPLRTREELAYYRLFQRELGGLDPGDVVGRFVEP